MLSVAKLTEVAVFATFRVCGLRKLQIWVENFFDFVFYVFDKFSVEIVGRSVGIFLIVCRNIFVVVDR